MSGRSGALGLAERLEIEATLEDAFAPLRSRRSAVGPTRVRAAVRWGRVEPAEALPWAGAVRRISELGIAVGMSAFVFAASLASVPPPSGAPIPVSEVEVVGEDMLAPVLRAAPDEKWVPRIVLALPSEERFVRWLKLDRHVPMEDRIDATIPPIGPEIAAQPEPLHLRLLRTLIPIR